MNIPEDTSGVVSPRAPIAVRTAVIARRLAVVVPADVATVRLTPAWSDGSGTVRRQTLVTLHYPNGRHVGADRAAHVAARDLLHQHFSGADWARPYVYDVRRGVLTATDTRALDAGGAL